MTLMCNCGNLSEAASITEIQEQKRRSNGWHRAAAALALNLQSGWLPHMLSRVCAGWLVVLVLLPFTAPFSTFDLIDLLSGQRVDTTGTPSPSPTPSTAASTHAVLARAVPCPLRPARLRPVLTRLRDSSVVPGAPVPAAGRCWGLAIGIPHPHSCPMIVLRI